jgi:hypothetical protein
VSKGTQVSPSQFRNNIRRTFVPVTKPQVLDDSALRPPQPPVQAMQPFGISEGRQQDFNRNIAVSCHAIDSPIPP